MVDRQSLESISTANADAMATYLEALAVGLREGNVTGESGPKAVALEVGAEVTFGLEPKSAGGEEKSSIDISVSWRARKRLPAIPPSLVRKGGTPAFATPSHTRRIARM